MSDCMTKRPTTIKTKMHILNVSRHCLKLFTVHDDHTRSIQENFWVTSRCSFPSCCYHKNLDYRGKWKCEHPQFHEKWANSICSSFRCKSTGHVVILSSRLQVPQSRMNYLLSTSYSDKTNIFLLYSKEKPQFSTVFKTHAVRQALQ